MLAQPRTTKNNTDQPRKCCIHGHRVLSGLPDVYRETLTIHFSGCSLVRFSFGLWLVSKPYFISNIGITTSSSYGHPSHPKPPRTPPPVSTPSVCPIGSIVPQRSSIPKRPSPSPTQCRHGQKHLPSDGESSSKGYDRRVA